MQAALDVLKNEKNMMADIFLTGNTDAIISFTHRMVPSRFRLFLHRLLNH